MRLWVLMASMVFGSHAVAEDGAPCPHPYFPMAEGLKLTYRAGKSEVVVSFSDVNGSGTGQSAKLHVSHKERDGATLARCTAEGIRTELGGLEGAALTMSGMDVKVVASEGIAMPPPALMSRGAQWANTLSLELRPPKGSTFAFALVKTNFRKESSVVGAERVNAAGRWWDALRVRNRLTAMAGTSGERTVESTMWIAPDVGILRIQTGDTIDFELIRVDRPPTAKGPALPGGRGASR
jgi:hypothetical protein